MEIAVAAASWALGKALAAAKDGLLETWAASTELGDNLEALELELIHAQWILENAPTMQGCSAPLQELLMKLRQVAYDADDVFDELEYYRIQDSLDGIYHAADVHDAEGFFLNARYTANAIGKRLTCCSFPSAAAADDPGTGVLEDPGNGRRVFCCACPSRLQQRKHAVQIPKLKFDRVEISTMMKNLVEKFKPICAKFSAILDKELLASVNLKLEQFGSTRPATQRNAMNRPYSTLDLIEPKLYGRLDVKRMILDNITSGKYCDNQLTVLPIVGPGGIGKTTFTQHVYHEVMSHFQISIWVCVSTNFNANRLAREIMKQIPKVDGEKENSTDFKLIEERIKTKKFLLVLDDMWTYHEDEWRKLLAPFTRVRSKVRKLKGNPLAAKIIGRMLRDQLTCDHWCAVLERKEWEDQNSDIDIMPALKISYAYLPFHLKKCFSYLAMFPEDYEFHSEELIHFWIGIEIFKSYDGNIRVEDIGRAYINNLIIYGFLLRRESNDGHPYYVVHDLIHVLAVEVLSKECISINSKNIRSIQISPSVRHLSIIVDADDVKNRMSFECYKNDLSTLNRRLKIQSLRTLMLFGEHHGSFAKTFGGLFRDVRALRTIILLGASYAVEDVLHNFSRLVHLRYLKITSVHSQDICLLSALCRLYQLEVIDLRQWKGLFGSSARHMGNLQKLRHFLVPYDEMHSSISEVGKLKSLQELKQFEVKKENQGFDLMQIGVLGELGGSLHICHLEKVEVKEAEGAHLLHKNHLRRLTLDWDSNRSNKDHAQEEQEVLENLQPNSNLQELRIIGHGGATCPSWLSMNLSVNCLESLHLNGVAWKVFPPIGEFWLVKEHGEKHTSSVVSVRFWNLRRLELVNLPRLEKWVVDGPCMLFPHLEQLIIKKCFELVELSFLHSTCCAQREKEAYTNCFPRLQQLEIQECPKLLSFPSVPWNKAPCYFEIGRVGSSFERLVCWKTLKSEYSLQIEAKDTLDSLFWNVLNFANLIVLNELEMARCPPLALQNFQMLCPTDILRIYDAGNVFLLPQDGIHGDYHFPTECLDISRWYANGKELSELLTCFPKLKRLCMHNCEKITELGVLEQLPEVTLSPSSSSKEVGEAQMVPRQPQQGGRDGEIEALAEGVLLLPPHLEELEIRDCPELSLRPNSLNSEEEGRTGGGLQGLHSLHSLEIRGCPKFLSSFNSSSSSCFPFPTSLQKLCIIGVEGMETLAPLSNLTSVTELYMRGSGNLGGEGLQPLLVQGHLTELSVFRTPIFFPGLQSELPEPEPPRPSSLLSLQTDGIAGVLAVPLCALLSSSLTKLIICDNDEVERFTEEQEKALHLLTSLQEIEFRGCDNLRLLPAGLHRLPNLKRLLVGRCPAFQSLPKDGLPSSLQELVINNCPAIRSLPKAGLPSSLRRLVIQSCPSIRSLPKANLPSLLQELDVSKGNNKELRRQCRKLVGTVPIVKV
ncbi:hypothetical protein ACP4OV_025650 [Aristida adscensionis]